jgi:predicted nucleotidyltransferase
MTDPLLERDLVLAEILRRLVEALHPERIYLFGSKARGDAGPDSDYDLLAVIGESDFPPHRRDRLAFRAPCGVGTPKDLVVSTREQFKARREVVCSLPATVLLEGRLMYAA